MVEKVKRHFDSLIVILLLLVTISLRFPNLGYSDYIGDEHKAFFNPKKPTSTIDFFLNQRKGPMQFVVSFIPYTLVGNFRNELAERLPFTIFNTAAIIMFYFVVARITKDKLAGLLAALVLAVNGFVSGFGRIAQYQNLNMFFSFSALYFYLELLEPIKDKKRIIIKTCTGSLLYALSFLSHWDAIFVGVPISLIFIRFLLNKDFDTKFKVSLLIKNVLIFSLLTLPFFIPYFTILSGHTNNQGYFARRISLGHAPVDYRFLIELYNPFFTFWYYIFAGIVGAIFIKKSYVFVAWFAVVFTIFLIFMRTPDTHTYNFLIPVCALCGIAMAQIINLTPKWFKVIPAALAVGIVGILYYQTYMIFVDHKVEYPWQQETLFGKKTRAYSRADGLPMFGFPLSRHWNEINNYINQQNLTNREFFGYVSNEEKTISEFYMDTKNRVDGGFYAVGIKRPLSFVNDWGFPQFGGKKKVYEIKKDDETVVRIYRIE